MAFKSTHPLILLLAASLLALSANAASTDSSVNPIRRVVTLLQQMQHQITEEGKKEKDLYDKYMCWCKNSGASLKEAVSLATDKVPAVGSQITASEEKLLLTKEELSTAQQDRVTAKDAIKEATALREKAFAEFSKQKTELDANVAAIEKAVAALEHGMAGGFLQTPSARTLRKLAASSQQTLSDDDRQILLSFLAASATYVPASGQVTGILKELGDDMKKNRAEIVAIEKEDASSHDALMVSKNKEILALTDSIESKTAKIGDLGVSIAQLKNDLTDTQEALLADQNFIAELDKGCETKQADWEERSKTRAEELVAIADTIKVLNDDDALDLFKATMHDNNPSSSFVQVRSGVGRERSSALSLLKDAARAAEQMSGRPGRARLDLIALALSGRQVGFEKVIGMVDEMIQTLKVEQQEDDSKKEYCNLQLDAADDKRKGLERKVEDAETAKSAGEGGVKDLAEEIKTLTAGIKALDAEVAEATKDRQTEHSAHTELMAHNSAAKDLLAWAKNRLNKFYNPKLHVAPPKRELSEEERIAENLSFTQLSERIAASKRDAPPPPPQTFGAYSTKSQESNGAISMIDMLVRDLEKEMTEAETSEKDAQRDYEAAMSNSAAKRAADTKSLTGKQSTKAQLESSVEEHKESKAIHGKELMATMSYISSLHAECDWLVKFYDMRKEARASEVDSLKNAKAVLSGADFSMLQHQRPLVSAKSRRTGFLSLRAGDV